MIVCHIRTSAGARFSTHENEEELRQELISYWNEVHADTEGEVLEPEAPLHYAIDTIEGVEDVSWEEIADQPKLKLFLVTHTDLDGSVMDWFAVANDRQQAIDLWRKDNAVAPGTADEPTWVFHISCADISITEPKLLSWRKEGEIEEVSA